MMHSPPNWWQMSGTLPDELRALGYDVTEIGQTQRILPHAIAEELVTTPSGALAPVTEGSTKPVTMRVTHAGLATVTQYDLSQNSPTSDTDVEIVQQNVS